MKVPHEFKVMRVRECVAAETIDTPEKAAEYWRANIPQAGTDGLLNCAGAYRICSAVQADGGTVQWIEDVG